MPNDSRVCCSVLQCVVVCCSVLQCVCSVLQCVAVCCSALQCVCSALQCVAVCGSVLQDQVIIGANHKSHENSWTPGTKIKN